MNSYPIDEIRKKSLKYFKGDSLSSDVWIRKYSLKDSDDNYYELSPEDMHNRLAEEFARIEAKYPNALKKEEIFKLLDRFKYIVPQGSPMSGIGNNFQKVSISNCFTEDTKVFTFNKGTIEIKDIEIGDLVPTHTGEIKPVEQLHKNILNDRQIYEIKTFRTPKIKVTENHRFLSLSKEQLKWGEKPQWNSIKYLREGDYIAIPNTEDGEKGNISYIDSLGIFKDLNLEKYEINQYPVHPETKQVRITLQTRYKDSNRVKPHKYEIYKDWELTEDLAFFLGYWFGDGFIYGDKNKIRGLGFVFNYKEVDNIDFVVNFAKKVFNIDADINDNKDIDSTVQVLFSSAYLGEVFNSLFGRYSYGKHLNQVIYNFKKPLLKSFLAGLISSDGTVTKDGDVRIVLNNKKLVRDIYNLFRANGFNLGYSENETSARLDFPKNNNIVESIKKVYSDDRIEKTIQKEESKTFTIDNNNYTLLKIQKKEKLDIKPEYVYTFGVKDVHSYSVEGLISENCFVVGNKYDSYGGILHTDEEQIQLMKRRGGRRA
jgi:uncharacterized protein YktA (UPF0223 family)